MFVTNITYIVCVCLLYPLKIWQMDIYISACRQSVTNLISVLVLWGLRYFICIKIHVYWRKKFSEKEFLKQNCLELPLIPLDFGYNVHEVF